MNKKYFFTAVIFTSLLVLGLLPVLADESPPTFDIYSYADPEPLIGIPDEFSISPHGHNPTVVDSSILFTATPPSGWNVFNWAVDGVLVAGSVPEYTLPNITEDHTVLVRLFNCTIDIKPGSYPNSINRDGNGVIPVAILGGNGLEVKNINLTNLSFAGLALRVKGNGSSQCSIKDVNGDGDDDLVCQFVDDPILWKAGDDFAYLSFYLNDGTFYEGWDEIKIVP